MVLWLASIAVLLSLVIIVEAAVLGELFEWRAWRAMTQTFDRRRPATVGPPRRPIEDIGADLRRISAGFHHEGMRFAQYEGRRQAYDRVLGEACDAVRVPHLIGVLLPGAQLDLERERVERRLAEAGLLETPIV